MVLLSYIIINLFTRRKYRSLGTSLRLAHPLDWLSMLDYSITKKVTMPKRAVFERSRRELFLDVLLVGVHIFLVVEQSSLESQSRRCAKTPILTTCVLQYFFLFLSGVPAWRLV